ncbi:hypothetical protein EDB19DRAFT_1687300 [Suillus lakei]|nr:hypothetical protein EDB19DRAFT_1687300 [Suillus lakei]
MTQPQRSPSFLSFLTFVLPIPLHVRLDLDHRHDRPTIDGSRGSKTSLRGWNERRTSRLTASKAPAKTTDLKKQVVGLSSG